ncbi:amidotransferase [Bacteroidia bacterium]|nr:amidotransferase [Bacteroidia bacterium]
MIEHFGTFRIKMKYHMSKSVCRVHYIQHVSYEGIGYIGEWIKENGSQLSVTKMYEEHIFPNLETFDLLVVMGGPMGAYDEDIFPWLKGEKEFIRQAIDADKAVLGICLGSQLIANVLGAKVYPAKEKEIGWWPVTFTDSAAQELFGSNELSPVFFQWHGDTFDLPVGVKHLASSEAFPNQAFLYKDNVLALQFHFEATEESCNDIIDNGYDEQTKGKYIRSKADVFSGFCNIPVSNQMMKTVLDNLTKRL